MQKSLGVILLCVLLTLLGISLLFRIDIGNPEIDRVLKGLLCIGASICLFTGR